MYAITGGHTYIPNNPCRCFSTPSDFVTLSGLIHVLTQVTPGPTGTIEAHANLIDVTGVGTTGCPYRAVVRPGSQATLPQSKSSRAPPTSSHRLPLHTPRSR